MIPRSVKAPTIPIPFHKLLKVVAIVDSANPQTKQLLDHIAAENFEVEVTDSFDRDIAEDASVGAYIALIDGERRERARQVAQSVRAIGFQRRTFRRVPSGMRARKALTAASNSTPTWSASEGVDGELRETGNARKATAKANK